MPFPSSMHESEKWKWSLSVVSDSSRPHGLAYQAPLSMGFSRQEYWSGSPLPSPHESCNTSQEVRPLGIHFSQETVRCRSPTLTCENIVRPEKKIAWGPEGRESQPGIVGRGEPPPPAGQLQEASTPCPVCCSESALSVSSRARTLPAPPVRPLGGLALVSCPVLWNKGFLAHGLSKSSSWDSISICLLPSA